MCSPEGFHHIASTEWNPNARQRRVLDLVTSGKTNREIAKALSITLDGAKWHVAELMAMTGTEDRHALAAWWRTRREAQGRLLLPLVLLRRVWPAGAIVAIVASLALLTPWTERDAVTSVAPDEAAFADFSLTASPQAVMLLPPEECPVTQPNGSTPPGERASPGHHGNGYLWTGLYPNGVVTFSRDGPGSINPDGSLVMKFGWWRGASGPLVIEGSRLDGEAPPLRAEIPDGYGPSGFQVTGLIFGSPGCWEVTGHVGDHSLTFVTYVVLTD